MSQGKESREKAVPKYFLESPKPPEQTTNQFMMGLGGALGIFGIFLFLTENSICLAAPTILLGAALAFKGYNAYSSAQSTYNKEYERTEPKPTDEQMDKWKNADLQRIKDEALEKLDLLAEQLVRDPDDPIMVVGPSSTAMAKVGKDGIIRFSMYDILIVHFTDYHLAAYKCTLDMRTGMTRNESTQEYHYTDVVSVATQTDSSGVFALMMNGDTKSISSYQRFALSVASGEQIHVAIAFPQLGDIIKHGRIAPTGADEAIKVIRARLREKKGGISV